jgi:hypothetical protein
MTDNSSIACCQGRGRRVRAPEGRHTAVGSYSPGSAGASGNTGSLAQRWNGTRWTIQATPSPAGAFSSELLAVSCAAPRACTAVGSFNQTPTRVTSLAETWNGTRWQIQPVPSPADATASYLYAVSCTSPHACTATGFYNVRSGEELALAERWNGRTWRIQATPAPAPNRGHRDHTHRGVVQPPAVHRGR